MDNTIETTFSEGTPEAVRRVLESARLDGYRVRLWYGKDGKCWNDEFDTIGKVSRSTGTKRTPILIPNSRSTGGGAILDDCIIKVERNHGKGRIETLYVDPSVWFDTFISTDLGNVYNETRDKLYARTKNGEAGRRLADFMNGKRWSK